MRVESTGLAARKKVVATIAMQMGWCELDVRRAHLLEVLNSTAGLPSVARALDTVNVLHDMAQHALTHEQSSVAFISVFGLHTAEANVDRKLLAA